MHSIMAKHGIGQINQGITWLLFSHSQIAKKGIYKCYYGFFFATSLATAIVIKFSVPTSLRLIIENQQVHCSNGINECALPLRQQAE